MGTIVDTSKHNSAFSIQDFIYNPNGWDIIMAALYDCDTTVQLTHASRLDGAPLLTDNLIDDHGNGFKFKSRKGSNGRFQNISGGSRPNLLKAGKWILTEKNLTGLPPSEELDRTLPIESPDLSLLNTRVEGDIRITWVGHATVILQMEGMSILTDPIFSERCSPIQHSPFGYKRFRKVPLTVEELPPIDIVIISHDHYDHL